MQQRTWQIQKARYQSYGKRSRNWAGIGVTVLGLVVIGWGGWLEPARGDSNSSPTTPPTVRPVLPPTPDQVVPAPITDLLRLEDISPAPGSALVSFVGDPNLVVTATAVRIVGADPDLQAIVRQRIQTVVGGETSQQQLQRDAVAILRTGLFTTVRVTTQANPAGVGVLFAVEPTFVRSVRLAPEAQILTPEQVQTFFQPELNTPLNLNGLYQSVQQVNQWYRRNGYRLGRVVGLRPLGNGVFQLDVIEGRISQVNIRFVDPDGNPTDKNGQPVRHLTQDSFIRRQVRLKPGQIYRDDLIRQDIQSLKQLGFLEQVVVTLAGEGDRTVVNYDVTERSATSVPLSAGYNEVSGIYGVIGYRDTNVGGLGQQFAFDVQVGARDIQPVASFTSPYRPVDSETWGYRFEAFNRRGLSNVFDDRVRLINGEKIQEENFGGGASITRAFGPWLTTFGLNYTRTRIRDASDSTFTVDRLGNPLSFSGTGIDDLTTVSIELVNDQRNQAINPTQGSWLSLRSEQSLPIGLGNITMNRLQANYVQYLPVEWLRSGNAPEVLVFNVQAGTVIGDLPPYRAFTLGGPDSVRGYDYNQVGSGRSYVLLSTEYRFPLLDWPVSGVLFADYASDLGSASSVLGQPAIVRGRPGYGFGYGTGLRIQSPIGILRLDFGFNDRGEGRVHFGLGQRY